MIVGTSPPSTLTQPHVALLSFHTTRCIIHSSAHGHMAHLHARTRTGQGSAGQIAEMTSGREGGKSVTDVILGNNI